MKRIIAVILGLALLACAMTAAAEEETGKVTLGTISINGAFTLQCGLPEGYSTVPVTLSREQVIVLLQSKNPADPVMYLSVAYDETYSGVERMNDLDGEALALLEKTFTDTDPGVEITYGETGYGTLLLIARHNSDTLDYISFLSIYKGYFVEFVLTPSPEAEDQNLTEDQMRLSIDFLTDLDFIPAEEAAAAAPQTYTEPANIGAYNPDTGRIEVSLMTPILVQPEYLQEVLKVGEPIDLGYETITVETIESDEYYQYIINGQYQLKMQEDGLLRLYEFDAETMMEYSEQIHRPYRSRDARSPRRARAVYLRGIPAAPRARSDRRRPGLRLQQRDRHDRRERRAAADRQELHALAVKET